MAIYQQEEQTPSSIFDSLYCEEENFQDEENNENNFEDDELIALFSKEKRQRISMHESCCDVIRRKEVVEWMLMVNNYFGFSTLTSVLSVNYLDGFLTSFYLHKDKPWTLQLVAVTCLSLAAKVEETFVPLLVDLQVEGTKYMFEAKNIQKMELLVLSTLEWKMHLVTPLSFIDHMIGRLGLKHHLHWEFMRRCESLLVSLLPDWRFVECLPSVLASATMMHVIDQIEPCNALDYHNQLMGVFKISKEKVNDYYQLIKEVSSTTTRIEYNRNHGDHESAKRKWEQVYGNNSCQISGSSSPSGIIDASYIYLNTYDTSNDLWATTTTSNHSI